MEIKNKVVLLTGASRGIGEAAARYLAQQGAKIVLTARRADVIARIAQDIGACAVPCDVSRYEALQAAVDTAITEFGRLDVLVNNAGLIDPIARLDDSDPAAWARVVDVNLKGVYHGLRAAAPVMRGQGGGTIINISSGAATSALEGWSHYCATKAGVLSLTRCADRELREHGIRVIGLSPGTVATDMQISIKESGLNPVSRLDPKAHISTLWVAQAIGVLIGPKGEAFVGQDFSLKTEEGRKIAGLPPL